MTFEIRPDPFRKSASVRIITGQTVDPFDSLAYNSWGSRYVSPEAKHTHEVGKDKDIIIVDVNRLKERLFLSIFRVFEKKFVFSLALFSENERETLERLGVELLRFDENNYVIISFGGLNLSEILANVHDVFLRIKLKHGFDNKLTFSINMGGEEERAWFLAQETARRLSDEICSMTSEELEIQIKHFILSHEIEHMRCHLSCSQGISLEETFEFLRSLKLGLSKRKEESEDDGEYELLDQQIDEFQHLLLTKLGTYGEALSILSEFSHHSTEDDYKLQVLPILFRLLNFFCFFNEKNNEQIFDSLFAHTYEDQPVHYILATLSILFKRDIVSEGKIPPIAQVLSRIEEVLADPEHFISYEEWQTLHSSFEQRMSELYEEARVKILSLKSLQKKLNIQLIKPFI